MALVRGRLEVSIFGCRFLPRKLLGSWRHFLSVLRSGFLFSSRLCFHSIRTVKAGTCSVHLLVRHRAIDIGVMDNSIVHARHSGVITERISFPSAAPIAVPVVAIAVINPSVITDSRPPVPLVKRVNAIVPAPPGRGPKHSHCRRSHPD